MLLPPAIASDFPSKQTVSRADDVDICHVYLTLLTSLSPSLSLSIFLPLSALSPPHSIFSYQLSFSLPSLSLIYSVHWSTNERCTCFKLCHRHSWYIFTFQLLGKCDCGFSKFKPIYRPIASRHLNWPLVRFRTDDKYMYDSAPNMSTEHVQWWTQRLNVNLYMSPEWNESCQLKTCRLPFSKFFKMIRANEKAFMRCCGLSHFLPSILSRSC